MAWGTCLKVCTLKYHASLHRATIKTLNVISIATQDVMFLNRICRFKYKLKAMF